MKTDRPDILDLNDWAVFHAPDAYAVAKYLTDVDNFYDVLHAAWIAAGRPMTLDFKGSRTT